MYMLSNPMNPDLSKERRKEETHGRDSWMRTAYCGSYRIVNSYIIQTILLEQRNQKELIMVWII